MSLDGKPYADLVRKHVDEAPPLPEDARRLIRTAFAGARSQRLEQERRSRQRPA